MKYFIKKSYLLIALLVLTSLSGCAQGFNVGLENALGGLGRNHVEYLGAPSKECELVKMKFTDSYAIFMDGYMLRLGEEYPDVRPVLQFSYDRTDYVVLACRTKDGALKNILLEIPTSASKVRTYPLDSSSNKQFKASLADRKVVLTQETNNSKERLVWYISHSGLRGPIIVANKSNKPRSKAASKSSTSSNSQGKRETLAKPLDIPVINPNATPRLEVDAQITRQSDMAGYPTKVDDQKVNDNETKAQPSTNQKTKPVIVIGAPKAAKEVPQYKEENSTDLNSSEKTRDEPNTPSTTSNPKPVIILKSSAPPD